MIQTILTWLPVHISAGIDHALDSAQNTVLQCSHYVPEDLRSCGVHDLPVVVYCHGNGSSRCEADDCIDFLLPHGMTLFCFDFSGSGLSTGDTSSMGIRESRDLSSVLSFLRRLSRGLKQQPRSRNVLIPSVTCRPLRRRSRQPKHPCNSTFTDSSGHGSAQRSLMMMPSLHPVQARTRHAPPLCPRLLSTGRFQIQHRLSPRSWRRISDLEFERHLAGER